MTLPRLRWLPTRCLLLACGSFMAWACAQAEPRELHIQLVPRSSCGRSLAIYDASCIRAVELELRDAGGTQEKVFKTQCKAVTGMYESFVDMVSGPSAVTLFSDIRARDQVRLAFRAYHAFNYDEPCVDLSTERLMIWGSSDVIDLSSWPSKTNITVYVECRPGCHCGDFSVRPDQCPEELVRGVCAPVHTALCRRPCGTGGDCYQQGVLSCAEGVCQPERPGGPCGDCSQGGDADCDGEAGLRCITNLHKSETFCGELCPPAEADRTCLPHMSCKRMGDGIYERSP